MNYERTNMTMINNESRSCTPMRSLLSCLTKFVQNL